MNKVLSITGLDAAQLAPVIKGLETLLATLQVHYTNLRGYHWHVRGPQFFVLHEQFEKMYDDVAEKVDEVAERLLQLDVQPENRFSVLLGQSKIKETTLLKSQQEIMPAVIESYKALIALEREIIEAASEAGDEVTVALLGDYLAEQEKTAWMLAAYLD